MRHFAFFLFLSLLFIACKKDANNLSEYSVTPLELDFKSTSLSTPNVEEAKHLTKEIVKLGRFLFYETALSEDNSISCASCHRQENAFADPNQFSEGVYGRLGRRQAMAIFNMAWKQNGFFWDGRAETLHDQALMPIQDHLEMSETLANIQLKLAANPIYDDLFNQAYGSAEITTIKIAKALEQFMLTIVSDGSKYDYYRAGLVALSPAEERGRILFNTKMNNLDSLPAANCIQCHRTNRGTFDDRFYLANAIDSVFEDKGRGEVTGYSSNDGQFRVVSLRNLSFTAPYMHDGRFKTLEEVINHYSDGIVVHDNNDSAVYGENQKGMELSDDQKADLLAFLLTLDDYELIKDTRYSSPF